MGVRGSSQFYNTRVGVRGSSLHGHVFMMSSSVEKILLHQNLQTGVLPTESKTNVCIVAAFNALTNLLREHSWRAGN